MKRFFHSAKSLMSSVTSESLEASIRNAFKPVHVEVVDVSGGCGQSYQVLIVSDAFEGKTLIQRHRLVNDALKNEISKMHAFSQKSLTPSQWKK